MERLTRECWQYTHNDCEDEEAQSFANKLATYEDTGLEPSEIESLKSELQAYKQKLADGRMVELPCKVGDTVYEPNKRGFISIYKIRSIELLNELMFCYWELIDGIYGSLVGFKFSDIGKTVFLTESEARLKLGEGEQ